MELSREQVRLLLLYEFRLGHTAADATRNICDKMDQSIVSYHAARNWFQKFKDGDYNIEDASHPGRAPQVDVDRLKQLIEDDPRLTTLALGEELGCSHTAIENHLYELGKRWKYGAWIPHELTANQLQARVDACMHLLTFRRKYEWLRQLITGDEKWVLYVNHTRKRQWLSTGESGIATAKPELHPQKIMLSVWWNVKGVVHWELLANNSTINADTYCQQLDRVAQKLQGKQDRVYFLHDNARPHVANVTCEKLLELGWTTLVHPPYSPDLAPTDYHLYRSLSDHFREKKFEDEDSIKTELANFFASQPAQFYERGILSLPDRWRQVVVNNGMYID